MPASAQGLVVGEIVLLHFSPRINEVCACSQLVHMEFSCLFPRQGISMWQDLLFERLIRAWKCGKRYFSLLQGFDPGGDT